ncbi:MAG: hypothetical protein ACK5NN_09410, partial [Sphingomonadaceae bacterium]
MSKDSFRVLIILFASFLAFSGIAGAQSTSGGPGATTVTTQETGSLGILVNFPDVRETLDGLNYADAAVKAATTEIVQTALTLLSGMEPDGRVAQLGIGAKDFAAEFALNPQAMLANIGTDIVVSAGQAALAEASGDLVSGYMFASGPLSKLPDPWQVPLRAFVDATIVESVGLLFAGTNPTPASLVGPILDRLNDVYEIYEATNALSRTQATGLFAVANGAEITAELVGKYPSEKAKELETSWLNMTRENLNDIVGRDDARTAYAITVLGYRALGALGRGDVAAAQADIQQMRRIGDAAQGPTPLSAEGPIDLLVRLANGGNDAPNVLVETFLKSTKLQSVTAAEILQVGKPKDAPPQMPQYESDRLIETTGGAYIEPQRGTQLRKDILDAVRPVAIEAYGAPIEFVVDSIRVSSNRAYVDVFSQRPGGIEIDIRSTPAFL